MEKGQKSKKKKITRVGIIRAISLFLAISVVIGTVAMSFMYIM